MKSEDYIEEIENLKQSVNDAEKNLKNKLLLLVSTQESYAASLKEKHSLSLLVNSRFQCHHFYIGFFNGEHRAFYMLENELIKFNQFTVHEISSGKELNEKISDGVFDDEKNYVVYVLYDYPEDEKYESHISQMKLIPFNRREILEYLIFEQH
jgi:hypothetical protein